MIKPFPHQKKTLALREQSDIVLDLSEPGTGKTIAHLLHFAKRRKANGGAGLVVAPLSLIDTVWPHEAALVDDRMDVSCAFAANRAKAFQPGHDLYVTNYEGLRYLEANPKVLKQCGIDWALGDEATAFKNGQTGRTKQAMKVFRDIEFKALLSGSLGARTITDYWAPAMILDKGKRLGWQFSKFRNAVCIPIQRGPSANMIEWVDREGADLAVAQLLSDISIRHLFKTTVKQSVNTISFQLPKKLRVMYESMAKQQAMLLKNQKVITAVNGGVAAGKLLQIAAGSIYDNDGVDECLDMSRYELCADLAEARPKTLMAFHWHHQRDIMIKLLEKRGRRVEFIDGTVTKQGARKAIVDAHKRGEIDDLLLQPAAAAHGLTLVDACSTIWISPTHNYELFDQLNRRTYRTGQKQDCEVIVVVAENTLDQRAFEVCTTRGARMNQMFDHIMTFA